MNTEENQNDFQSIKSRNDKTQAKSSKILKVNPKKNTRNHQTLENKNSWKTQKIPQTN